MLRQPKHVLLLLTGILTVSGCVLPDYYTPAGYSSTQHRRLSESTVVWPEPEPDSSQRDTLRKSGTPRREGLKKFLPIVGN